MIGCSIARFSLVNCQCRHVDMDVAACWNPVQKEALVFRSLRRSRQGVGEADARNVLSLIVWLVYADSSCCCFMVIVLNYLRAIYFHFFILDLFYTLYITYYIYIYIYYWFYICIYLLYVLFYMFPAAGRGPRAGPAWEVVPASTKLYVCVYIYIS